MELEKKEFRNSYTIVFTLNYFIQGINQSMFATIVPIFLILQLGAIGGAQIAFFSSIVLLPFAVKFIYGMMSDRLAFKRIGRRKPWIISSVSLAGVLWMLIPFLVTPSNALMIFTLIGLFIVFGIAMGDTSIDGLILDICPREIFLDMAFLLLFHLFLFYL
ncbi:MAG: hypothetical protein P8Y97_14760 [Candidatus Lokiarchaeota archaeon]